MKKIHSFIALFFALTPFFAFAEVTDLKSLLQLFVDLLGSSMVFLYMLALAAFFWGIALFIFNTDDDKKRAEGKSWMMWSVIALFVMFSIWGIVGLIINTLQINPLIIPQLK